MGKAELAWLPQVPDWSARIARAESAPSLAWSELVALAHARLDFMRTERLDRLLQRHFGAPPPELGTRPVRLAVLGSSTVAHLQAPIRVAALRRGLWVTIYEAEYGQYYQELLDPQSALHRFRPDVVLLALDAHHLTAGVAELDGAATLEAVTWRLKRCWQIARETLGASVIQQTVLPVIPALLGSNEQRLSTSAAAMISRLNASLRDLADAAEIHLLALDARAAEDGVRNWHDPVLWHRAKQEVAPTSAPVYGDMVARLLAALQGRSSKCLVLDLDNTLWGGVIGDDGIEGIVLGSGSALGEAFLAVQDYALQLSRRGVILAVCSKNDEQNAFAAFDSHPEMLLRRTHIASFVANWEDKPSNLRRIARELNIGIDSLVFLDDNPFERDLVRAALPEVAVPEIPDDDPAAVPGILADAGYFEALAVTAEDRERGAQYQANRERAMLEQSAVDLPSYLRGLGMKLICRRFDEVGLGRIVQLINKTNQFNLRTRRYSTEDVLAVMRDPDSFGLQFRLLDRFGDNGVIAIVIGRIDAARDCRIDTWLMSCRVLGRQVEEAMLNIVAEEAERLGARRIIGEYLPTAKNAMVAEHYDRLGFVPLERRADGSKIGVLVLDGFAPRPVLMEIATGE